MEVRARYVLMGLFALAVIAGGFVFVFWLENSGGLASRTTYRLRFEGTVAGLLKGSAVLFNGVRVGEVSGVSLDASHPKEVLVDVSVDRSAPVRADSRVTIEFQGLAGAPAIALSGGSPTLPLLATKGPDARVLSAEKGAGESMTEAARQVLGQLSSILSENAKGVKSAISNIDEFTAALARNSGKVDGIVAGLERLTGGGAKPVIKVYDLAVPTAFPGLSKIPEAQLSIPEPTTLATYDSEKILVKAGSGEQTRIEGAQWPDVLPRVIQARMIQSFEASGYKKVMGRAPEGTKEDYQLAMEIRSFAIIDEGSPIGVVELGARLMSSEGKIVDSRTFKATVPASGTDAPSATKALRAAFQKVEADMVVWACSKI